MKYYFILSLILFSVNSITAQDVSRNQKLSGGFEFRYLKTFGIGVDYLNEPDSDFPDAHGKSLRLNLGYFFNPHIYTGLSVGADRYEIVAANTFPLTANVRYYFKNACNTFYTFAEGGPIIAFSSASDNGFTSALGIGYKFFVSKRTCLTSSIGFNYEKSMLDGLDATYYGEYLSRKSLLFSIGMHF